MVRHNVGILIFDNVKVLDFAGPFEVFCRTRLVSGPESRGRTTALHSMSSRWRSPVDSP